MSSEPNYSAIIDMGELQARVSMLEKQGARPVKKAAANPAPLGLFAFGLSTLNLVNAEIITEEATILVAIFALFYGGIIQIIVGFIEFVYKGSMLGGIAFSSYGAFWCGLGFMDILVKTDVMPAAGPDAKAGWLICFGLLTVSLWIVTFRVNRALCATFFGVVMLFVFLTIGCYNHTFHVIGGYEGIITGLVAVYTATGELWETMYGYEVIPLWRYQPPAPKELAAIDAPSRNTTPVPDGKIPSEV